MNLTTEQLEIIGYISGRVLEAQHLKNDSSLVENMRIVHRSLHDEMQQKHQRLFIGRATGVSAWCLIFTDFVVKFGVDFFGVHNGDAAVTEHKYNSIRELAGKLVAETFRVGPLVVQERIIPAIQAEVGSYSRWLPQLVEFATLTGVGDIHTSNWGFRQKDGELDLSTPVVFDLSYQGDVTQQGSIVNMMDAMNLDMEAADAYRCFQMLVEKFPNARRYLPSYMAEKFTAAGLEIPEDWC